MLRLGGFRPCRVGIRIGRRQSVWVQQPDAEPMTAEPSLARVVAPSHCEHVADGLDDDGLVPAFPRFIESNYDVASADLAPGLRKGSFAILVGAGFSQVARGRRRRWLTRLGRHAGRRNELGVQVAPDVRYEPSAVGVNTAGRLAACETGDCRPG